MIHFFGRVRQGAGRGKGLGFPTANIPASSDCENGIYIARVLFDGKTHPALCFVGVAEVFGEKERRAEAHLLDFDGDLYEKEIRVELLKKIRESKKFDSAEALVLEMKKDLKTAREYFADNS